jgi:RNA polymerase sigma-70 factor (ECF subfamily)
MPLGVQKTKAREDAAPLDLLSIHEEHAQFVWLSLQRLGVRTTDIEDLLQEVFIVVHKRLATFDGSARMTTWLFGICLRVAAAHRRRAYNRRESIVPAPADEALADSASPEDLASNRQAQARLAAILDTMDLEKRAIFVMFELDELSCEEIAEILGVPLGTVYSRLHAARKAFGAAVARFEAREGSRSTARRGREG